VSFAGYPRRTARAHPARSPTTTALPMLPLGAATGCDQFLVIPMNLDTTADDLILTCVECDQAFIFTAGEAAYFDARSLHQPRRCKSCRQLAAARRENAGLTLRYRP
jgi:hypothetical protein